MLDQVCIGTLRHSIIRAIARDPEWMSPNAALADLQFHKSAIMRFSRSSICACNCANAVNLI